MTDKFGSDFMTIVDEDGAQYELEVLTTLEYSGFTYLAVIPAESAGADSTDFQISILKSIEEDGEDVLCAIEDEHELEAVNNLLMEQLYEDEDTE